MLPSLTVALATTLPRLSRLGPSALPEPAPGLDVLVTVQGAGDASLPEGPARARSDVRLLAVPGSGLSNNRNAGLAAATGDLILFSDDDIRLDDDGLGAMRAAFAADPSLDLALGWREGRRPESGRRKGVHRLTRLGAGHACAPEIVVRTAPLRASGIRFDPRFGIGSETPTGEDYIFVADLLAAGLEGRGLPVVMGRHEGPSTGDSWSDPALLRARRRVLSRAFGRWAGPAALAYALRHRRRIGAAAALLRFARGG